MHVSAMQVRITFLMFTIALWFGASPLQGFELYSESKARANRKWESVAKKKFDEAALSAFLRLQFSTIKSHEGFDLESVELGSTWKYDGSRRQLRSGKWAITVDKKFRYLKVHTSINGSGRDVVLLCERLTPMDYKFLSIEKAPTEVELY